MSMLQRGQCILWCSLGRGFDWCGNVFDLEVKLVKMVLEGGEAELA